MKQNFCSAITSEQQYSLQNTISFLTVLFYVFPSEYKKIFINKQNRASLAKIWHTSFKNRISNKRVTYWLQSYTCFVTPCILTRL